MSNYNRILVRFEGGHIDGKSEWRERWTSYIDTVESPPCDLRSLRLDGPLKVTEPIQRTTYRLDTEPQPDGSFIARMVK